MSSSSQSQVLPSRASLMQAMQDLQEIARVHVGENQALHDDLQRVRKRASVHITERNDAIEVVAKELEKEMRRTDDLERQLDMKNATLELALDEIKRLKAENRSKSNLLEYEREVNADLWRMVDEMKEKVRKTEEKVEKRMEEEMRNMEEKVRKIQEMQKEMQKEMEEKVRMMEEMMMMIRAACDMPVE